MRVAILHDYLNQYGGPERVLETLLELFPDADLYTLMYDRERMGRRFRANLKKTSAFDFDFARKHPRAFLPFMHLAANRMASNTIYDLIISSSSGFAKGFPVRGKYHISYCHSPLRFAWEADALKDIPFSPLKTPFPFRAFSSRRSRAWDFAASRNVNVFVANSEYIRQKIGSYYGRNSCVIHPPVETSVFCRMRGDADAGYYLMAGPLLYHKRFDIGIRAFNEMKIPLKIVGRGPEEKKLRALANPRIVRFVSNVSDSDLRSLYAGARALVFPQIEDFGMVAAEAQACGTPVIAFQRGGACEIVRPGETGIFFTEQNVRSLVSAVREFETKRFDRGKIADSAERFSKKRFKEAFSRIVKQAGF